MQAGATHCNVGNSEPFSVYLILSLEVSGYESDDYEVSV
jgi:hypothetical protein